MPFRRSRKKNLELSEHLGYAAFDLKRKAEAEAARQLAEMEAKIALEDSMASANRKSPAIEDINVADKKYLEVMKANMPPAGRPYGTASETMRTLKKLHLFKGEVTPEETHAEMVERLGLRNLGRVSRKDAEKRNKEEGEQ